MEVLTNMPLLNILILIIASLIGLAIAGYIHGKKAAGEKLVCPIDTDCQTVIYSPYSKFLGIPVENLGVFYYFLISLSYTFFLFFPSLNADTLSFATLSITTVAFIFSLYLLFVQIIVLRRWCTWCLGSAILCTIIFVSVWSVSNLNLVSFINSIINNL